MREHPPAALDWVSGPLDTPRWGTLANRWDVMARNALGTGRAARSPLLLTSRRHIDLLRVCSAGSRAR
ncbi:hypothetical protein GCM10027168_48690 [Streptomyces capparidis]